MSDNAVITVTGEEAKNTEEVKAAEILSRAVNIKILHKTINLCLYVYIISMIIISVLLFINTLYNIIIYYNYKSQNDDDNGGKRLYVNNTFAYKLFINRLVDFNYNNNNTYFTLNVTNTLIYIFIILTMLLFITFIIIDIFIASKNIIKQAVIDSYKSGSNILLRVFIFVAIMFIVSYYLLLFNYNHGLKDLDYIIGLIAFYLIIYIFLTRFLIKIHPSDGNTEEVNHKNLSIYYIITTIINNRKYFFIYCFIFTIWIILLRLTYISLKDQNIKYDDYSFNTDGYNTKIYKSLEQRIYLEYFYGQLPEKIKYTRALLEGHNVNTISSIIESTINNIDSDKDKKDNYISKIIEFLKEIKMYSDVLSQSEFKNDDKLDFIKLMIIFINNIIIKRNQPRDDDLLRQNKIGQEFYYLTHSKERYETLNINNLLIGAFPTSYLK
jgi:hypothetical protein